MTLTPYQTAEVAQIDPTGGRLVAWAGAATAAHQLAQSLSKTSFVPRAFQGNASDGTPALYARTMVALAMSQGHEVWTESSTDREVVVCGKRRGSEHVERSSWTIERARKAGYTSNKKYDSDPQGMLYSKAAAEIARKIAPDVLSGVPYSVEDLELEEQPTARVSRSTARVQRERPQAPEPEFDEPAPEPVKAEAERVEEPITPKQLTALNAALTSDLGFTDRDDKLAYLSGELGREITSSKDVTKREAMRLLDGFAALAAAEPVEPTLPDGA